MSTSWRRVSLDGKNIVDFATNVYDAWFLVTDATDIYFGRVNDGIYRMSKSAPPPIDAGALPYLYDIPGDGPAALVADSDSLYYSSGDPSGTFPVSQSEILKIGKDGTLKAKLATSSTLIDDLALAGGYLYWTEEGTLAQDYTDGAVRRIKLDDPTAQPETYATKQSHPVRILVDGEYVYWLNGGWTAVTGGLMRIKR